MSDYHKGPWFAVQSDAPHEDQWNIRLSPDSGCRSVRRGAGDWFSVTDHEYMDAGGVMKPGDAYLIAAAPDLYEALVELLRVHAGPKLNCEKRSYKATKAAQAALSKARGESK